MSLLRAVVEKVGDFFKKRQADPEAEPPTLPGIAAELDRSEQPRIIKPMSKELANRKRRSQQKNWKKWRKRF